MAQESSNGPELYGVGDCTTKNTVTEPSLISQHLDRASADPLSPPLCVQRMTELDKSKFTKTIKVPCITLEEVYVGKLMKSIKKHVLCMRSLKNIIKGEPGKKTILLLPSLLTDGRADSLKDRLQIDESPLKQPIEYSTTEVELGYDNWSSEEILRTVLTADTPNVTGFSVIGHIAHLNLKDQHTPYKSVIGHVLLDKNSNLKSVVNKTDTIDNTYRNFKMELLAGIDDMNVTVKENGCAFQFDFSKVYWNSRLGTEHERLVKEITPDTVVYDVFAGVGPFSVPAARKGATVICNDLNPLSYEALVHNMKKNKVKGTYKTHNMDGRAFIREVVKPNLIWHLSDSKPVMVIMNLPALAETFLDAFIDLISIDENSQTAAIPDRPPIMIYCYCFSKVLDDKFEEDVCKRIYQILSQEIKPDQCRRVRNVAPNKEMMCAKFPLNWNVIFTESDLCPSQLAKKPKLDDKDIT